MNDNDIDLVKKFCLYTLSNDSAKMQLLLFSEFEKQLLSIIANSKTAFSGLIKLSWFYEQIQVSKHKKSYLGNKLMNNINEIYDHNQKIILLDFVRLFDLVVERKIFDSLEELNNQILLPLASIYTRFFLTLEPLIDAYLSIRQVFYIYAALIFIRLQKYFIFHQWYCFGQNLNSELYDTNFNNLITKLYSIHKLHNYSFRLPRLLKFLLKANKIYLIHYLLHIRKYGYNCPDINQGIVRIKLALAVIF